MKHGQCFVSGYGQDPDSVRSQIPIMITTERAGLEQQRREGYGIAHSLNDLGTVPGVSGDGK
jgi:hypothetical protein